MRVRASESQSDELRRLVYGISTSVSGIFVCIRRRFVASLLLTIFRFLVIGRGGRAQAHDFKPLHLHWDLGISV